MNQAFNQETNATTKEKTTIGGLEDLWKVPELARYLCSFIFMEDIFALEETSRMLQMDLSTEDSIGIWKNVKDTSLRTSIPPEWVDVKDSNKAHALAVLKADAFAKACEEKESMHDLQEMGSDVAYELFNIEELDGQEDFSKAGYTIFVRVSVTAGTACASGDDDSRGRDVLFRGFPLGHDLASAGGPICRHRLTLSIDGDSCARNIGYKKLLESLDTKTGQADWSSFVGVVNTTVVAVHQDRPYRLIRATKGLPGRGMAGKTINNRERDLWAFVPTKSCSSNAAFLLNGIQHSLDCDFGVVVKQSNELVLPIVSLAFDLLDRVDPSILFAYITATDPDYAKAIRSGRTALYSQDQGVFHFWND
jgi:hypothetical protein